MIRLTFDRAHFNDVADAIAGAPNEIKLGLIDAMQSVIFKIHATAVPRTPFKTGTLRRSLTFKINESEKQVEGIIGSNVVYARIQEFGGDTGRNRATKITGRHYLGSSISENRQYAKDRFLKIQAIKRK